MWKQGSTNPGRRTILRRNTKRNAVAFSASAAAGLVVGFTVVAQAGNLQHYQITYPAAMCQPMDYSAGSGAVTAPALATVQTLGGQLVNTSSSSAVVECPLLDFNVTDSNGDPAANSFFDSNYVSVTVNGFSNAGKILIALCTTYTLGGGGKCGSFTSTPANSSFSSDAWDYSAWSSQNAQNVDSGFILAVMSPPNNHSDNVLFNYNVFELNNGGAP
jgi:hypothetical protein